jgi:hypothetical protein
MFPHQNVQIMGSFDGWSQGEAMSMEYSGDYGRFSATLKLRPGRLVLSVFLYWPACFLHVNKLTVYPLEGMRSSFWLTGNGDCHLNIPLLEMEWRRTIFLSWSNRTYSSSILVIRTMPKWVSCLAYPNLLGTKGYVVVVLEQCRSVPSCLLPSVILCYHVVASQKSMFVDMQGPSCISVFFIVTYAPFVFKYMTNKLVYPERHIFKNGANTSARSQWFVLFYALEYTCTVWDNKSVRCS